MTSPEAGPLSPEAEHEDDVAVSGAVGTEEVLWETPWSSDDRKPRGTNGNLGAAPGFPAANPSLQNGVNPGTTVPGSTASAPAARVPGSAVSPPFTQMASGAPPSPPPGSAAVATPPVSGPPAQQQAPQGEEQKSDREPADPPVDPELLAEVAPMALMAGMSLLPILGSALSGLLGGGYGGGSGGGTPVPEGQLTPEAQRALEALDLLAEVYGDGPTDNPEVQRLREEVGASNGSGETARMVKAKRLFQRNAATAFNNLDNQLANYIKRLAGTNTVDKKAVTSLIREVNVALAELGPQAYTKEGQQQVREILTRALRKAQNVVSGGQTNADETATAIDKLTNQYLYNIAGKEVPSGYMTSMGAGGSAKARKAVEVALAQVGDPYVWGAEGPNSFDCSGLMQYAANAAGVDIPRVSQDQWRGLPKVAPNDLQPGDLIFPSSSFNGGSPGHVMMYIGNGQVVHAPSAGKNVEVKALPSSFQATRWA